MLVYELQHSYIAYILWLLNWKLTQQYKSHHLYGWHMIICLKVSPRLSTES